MNSLFDTWPDRSLVRPYMQAPSADSSHRAQLLLMACYQTDSLHSVLQRQFCLQACARSRDGWVCSCAEHCTAVPVVFVRPASAECRQEFCTQVAEQWREWHTCQWKCTGGDLDQAVMLTECRVFARGSDGIHDNKWEYMSRDARPLTLLKHGARSLHRTCNGMW